MEFRRVLVRSTLTYNVSDSDGLAATPVTRAVNVVSGGGGGGGGGTPPQCADGSDNDSDGLSDFPSDPGCDNTGDNDESDASPVLTLVGGATTTVTQWDLFVDPLATAFDLEDGDITASIVVTGSVDTTTVGVYVLTYNVTDSDGRLATPVTRTVNVVSGGGGGGGGTPPQCADGSDNDSDGLSDFPSDPGCGRSSDNDESDSGPTLVLIGDGAVTVTQGSTFTDLGATASDPEDGDLTDDVVVTGSVNTTVVGTYTLTHNVRSEKHTTELQSQVQP